MRLDLSLTLGSAALGAGMPPPPEGFAYVISRYTGAYYVSRRTGAYYIKEIA